MTIFTAFTTDRQFDAIRGLSRVAAAFLLISLVAVLLPADAAAMQFNARVSGTVTDANGDPLVGVKVTIMLMSNRRVDPIPPTEVTTDDKGRFFARNVRVGDSQVIFELEGYERHVDRREMRVGVQTVDATLNVDIVAAKVVAANIANAQYQEGYEAFVAEDFAAAVEHLQQALVMIDDTEENAAARGSVHALLGRAYSEQRDLQQTVANYREWVRYQPQDANAHIELASALNEMGERDEAMVHFEHALERNPQDPTSLYNIGVVMVNSGAVEEGAALIQRAIDVQPEFPLALKNLGYAYSRIEKYQEAVDAFEKYLEQDPEAADAAQILDFVVTLKEMIG